MKKNLLHQILTLTILLVSITSFSQKSAIEIPELDAKKNTHLLNFKPDPENKDILSSYITGSTKKDSLRFKAKISNVVERVMVTVLLKDKNEEAHIAIVKKHWKDIKRLGKTKNGAYQEKFDTAEDFGLIVWSDKPNVSFDMAVWTSGEIRPKAGQLFYAVNSNSATKNNAATANNNATDGNGNSKDNMLTYIIIAVLIIIAILLALLLVKRRKGKRITMLLLFFFSLSGLFAQTVESTARNFAQNAENYARGEIARHETFASDVRALIRGEGNYSFLDEDDQQDVPDTDPAGQPQLPSSCLSSYIGRDENRSNSNGHDATNKNNNNNGNKNNIPSTNKGTSNASTNNVEFQPMQTAEGNPNNKPDNGPGEQSPTHEKPLQLPRYNQNGNLINAGSFPNAPTHISTARLERTNNPYIETGTNSTQAKPTYDSNGHLKYPENFPYAPRKIDLSTGFPVMRPVLQGQAQQGSHSVKQPLYDKNGTLIDAGDYPNAPSKINPSTIDNNISREGSLSTKSSGVSSSSGNGANNTSNSANTSNNNDGSKGSDSKRIGGPNSNNNINVDGNDNDNAEKKEGCVCLENAYERLDKRRYNFEKIRIIAARIDRVTDFGLAFGDDVSGVHGVSGLVWQTKRKEIVQSMINFDKVYENKYQEMVKDLHDILLEIDRCEALLGFENWYSGSGFIYYTFMKDRYKRNDRKL